MSDPLHAEGAGAARWTIDVADEEKLDRALDELDRRQFPLRDMLDILAGERRALAAAEALNLSLAAERDTLAQTMEQFPSPATVSNAFESLATVMGRIEGELIQRHVASVAELADLQSRLAWRSAELQLVLNSTSWRLTGPLRALGRLFRPR